MFASTVSNNLGLVSTARAAQAIPILDSNLIQVKEESHRQRDGLMTYWGGGDEPRGVSAGLISAANRRFGF